MKLGILAALAALQISGVWAQGSLPDTITVQREALKGQRAAVMATFDQQAKDCWQQFAVNTCLSKSRQVRRTALEPIQQEQLRLNAEERAWRTEQRNVRLEGKKSESGTPP